MPLLHLYNMPHQPGQPDSIAVESDVWPPAEAIEYEGQRYKLTGQSPDIEETETEKRGGFYTWAPQGDDD